MIAVIRIKGQVGLKEKIINTLDRLRLRRKYACVVLEKPTPEQLAEADLISLDINSVVGLFISDVTQYTMFVYGDICISK